MSSSLSKACLELSNSLKTFRFTRSSNNDTASTSSSASSSSVSSSPSPTGGGTSATTTVAPSSSKISVSSSTSSMSGHITRVLRSATCKMKGITSPGSATPTAADHVTKEPKPRLPELWKIEPFLDRLFSNFADMDLLALRLVHPLWKRLIDCRQGRYDHVTAVLNYRQNSALEERLAFLSSILLRGVHSLKVVAINDAHCESFNDAVLPAETVRLVTCLSVHSSNINDVSMENMISKFVSIRSLKLAGCNEITEHGLWSCLSAQITSLSISDCINVADDTVGAISQLMPQLQSLELQAYHITDSALALFSGKQSICLQELRLYACWEITNNAVVNIARCLPNLRVLSLSGCSKVTDDGVELLAENLPRLEHLDLSWCSKVTDASLEFVACELVTLKTLVLDRCVLIGDVGIGYLSTMSGLEVLHLRWCPEIHDFALKHLVRMSSLRSLSLAGCSGISSAGLSGLIAMTALDELELTNCSSCNESMLTYLSKQMPYCSIIL